MGHKHTQTNPFDHDRASRAAKLLGAVFCLSMLAFLYQGSVDGVFDIGVYKGIGDNVYGLIKGAEGTIGSEYPPPATILFLFAHVNPLHIGFSNTWLLMVVLAIAGAGAYATYALRDPRGWLIPAAVAGTVFMTGPELVFGRYDVLVVTLMLLCFRARACNRFGHCAAFLAAACALKVVPALLVPVLFATAPRSQWKRMMLGFAAGLAASFAVPALAMGPRLTADNFVHMLQYHGEREVQLESTWSSVQMLMKTMVGMQAPVSMGHLSVNNADFGGTVMSIAKLLIVSMSVGAAVLALLRRKHARFHADSLALSVLAFSMAASPVFSPQYIVWILPLLLSWLAVRFHAATGRDAFWKVAALTAVAGFCTQWVFPLHYTNVIDQEPLALAVLNARNVAVLALSYVLFTHALFPAPPRVHRRSELTAALKRLAIDCAMLLVAVSALQGFRHQFMPTVSSVHYAFTDAQHGAAPGMQFSIPATTNEMFVTATLTLPRVLEDGRFYLKADDCFESLRVNGSDVPDGTFCGDGRAVDLAGLLRPGKNRFVAKVKNEGGPIGIIIKPTTLGPVHIALSVMVLAATAQAIAGLWTVGAVAAAMRRRAHHPASILRETRHQAAMVLQLSLLEPA